MEEHDSGPRAVFEVFEARPAPNHIERIRAHVAATGMPETFPGLHPGPIDKDESFHILGPISVPRYKRPDGKKAPCPRCHCPDKFFEGQLVWFWELRAVAVVGHCCASAQQSNEAIAEFRQREARERAEAYLLQFLFDVPRHLRRSRALAAPIAECQRVYDRFRKDGGAFQRALRNAVRGGSQLHVTEIIQPGLAGGPVGMRVGGSSVETVDVQYGQLAGQSAVATKCNLVADLAGCAATFERLDGYATDDAVLNLVAPMSDDEKVAAANDLAKAIKALAAIEEALVDFRRFFTDPNMERITAWGTHPENATPMKAECLPYRHGEGRLFGMNGLNGKKCAIIINSVLWADIRTAAAA